MNKKKMFFTIGLLLLLLGILVLCFLLNKTIIKLTIEEQIDKVKKADEYTRKELGFDYNTIFDKYNTVKFGKYYYDSNDKNKMDIEWIVLDKKDGYALLLSKYILDVNKMSENEGECQWANTVLREWLNSEFYNLVFNQNEKEKIIKCELENFNIPLSLHKTQEKTKDKVFVLSIEELQTYFYHISQYRLAEIATTATEYAFLKKGLMNHQQDIKSEEFRQLVKEFNSPVTEFDIKTASYWTRTFKDNKCLIIDYDGSIKGTTERKSNLTQKNGVRPAIWINYDNADNVKDYIAYDMFKKDVYLKEPNIEYDLSKTPSELNLFKQGEKNAYFKQMIDKKLEPKELKEFIDVDQLNKLSSKTADDLLQEIKNLAYKNVINYLLRNNASFDNLPVTDNYINSHPNLVSELKNISNKYEVVNSGIVNTKWGMKLAMSVYNVSLKTGYYKGGYGLVLFFDDLGNIDELEILELKY